MVDWEGKWGQKEERGEKKGELRAHFLKKKKKNLSPLPPHSLTRPVDSVVSMPSAAQAMPYIDASENDTKIAAAMQKHGMMVDLYPSASPKMMSVAAPVRHASATSCTGW